MCATKKKSKKKREKKRISVYRQFKSNTQDQQIENAINFEKKTPTIYEVFFIKSTLLFNDNHFNSN